MVMWSCFTLSLSLDVHEEVAFSDFPHFYFTGTSLHILTQFSLFLIPLAIDHIQQLVADRSALLARLHRARSSLPPGHPMLTPLIPDPPWEREWKGGEGRLGDEDPGGSGEEEEEEGE